MASLYLDRWSNSRDVCNDFSVSQDELKGCRVFVACYEDRDYAGNAYVLYAKGRTLYEVNSSHCSCYGLENTWDPEDTTVEALENRSKYGNWNACVAGNGQKVLRAVKRYLKKFDD